MFSYDRRMGEYIKKTLNSVFKDWLAALFVDLKNWKEKTVGLKLLISWLLNDWVSLFSNGRPSESWYAYHPFTKIEREFNVFL